MAEKIELGDQVQDTVSKAKGIAIAETKWLNGCVRWLVQLEGLSEGKTQEFSVDEIQLKVVKKGAVPSFRQPVEPKRTRTGGSGRPDLAATARPRVSR